jgi:pyruvate dehydrogenase E2 component (dihydrolipoamide acetyltransferase)
MSVFRMPSLGADMEAGTLVEWLVGPGARVRRGDIVAVVETQKGAIEIEIFEDGTVAELLAAPGTKLPVGAPLARISGDGEAAHAAPPAPAAPEPRRAPSPAPQPAPLAAGPPAAEGTAGRVRATPAARREAARLGIALAHVRGTGVAGAVRLADLAAEAAAPSRRAGFDPAAMRAAVGAAMARSKREIPHFYLSETVDLSPTLAWLERLNADRAPPERLLPAAALLRATARALAETPGLNGYWEDGGFRARPGVHVGWAVALRGGGLVAPAIRDADRLSLDAVMAAIRDLVARARGGGLRGSELTDPTITVTSLGDRGAEAVLPVIHPPQVAIIRFGRIVERPWVVEGKVVPRRVATLTLAADHRATDGHGAGLLLSRIDARLKTPEAP